LEYFSAGVRAGVWSPEFSNPGGGVEVPQKTRTPHPQTELLTQQRRRPNESLCTPFGQQQRSYLQNTKCIW